MVDKISTEVNIKILDYIFTIENPDRNNIEYNKSSYNNNGLTTDLLNDINNKLVSVYHVKGSINNINDLENLTNCAIGDVYNDKSTGNNYVYVETGGDIYDGAWDQLGTIVDLSEYYTKDEIDKIKLYIDSSISIINTSIDLINSSIKLIDSSKVDSENGTANNLSIVFIDNENNTIYPGGLYLRATDEKTNGVLVGIIDFNYGTQTIVNFGLIGTSAKQTFGYTFSKGEYEYGEPIYYNVLFPMETNGTLALTSDIPTIDTSLSSTSTNPIANNVVKSALGTKLQCAAVEDTTDYGDITSLMMNRL